MGAGKTTVGRLLAKRLKGRFVDSDHELEARNGVTIPVIFAIEGEAGFRQREAQIIDELSLEPGLVLATGGGAVLDPNTRTRLHDRGFTVYLCAAPEVLFERTRNDRSRPLLQVEDRLEKLRTLYAQRDPLYREAAHVIIPVGNSQASQVVKRILEAFESSCEN